MGLQAKSSYDCVLKIEPIINEKEKSEPFHIRFISKHTKIDTLFDSGSQANLILDEITKNLGLETKPHPKPYPLGWACETTQL